MMSMLSPWVAILGLLATLLGGAGIGGLVKTVLDHRRQMRKATDDVSVSLVVQLQGRLDMVEKTADRIRIDGQRERILCEARLRAEHHRGNHFEQLFNSLLMIWELTPEKFAHGVVLLKEQRAEMKRVELAEKASVDNLAARLIRDEADHIQQQEAA